MILKKKITIKKIFNAAHCFISYRLRQKKSGRCPFMINFELCNECNSNCIFCRTSTGEIYDLNPNSNGEPIPKGKMPFEMYAEIIQQAKDYLLMAALYINGEPLLYKDLCKSIKFASDNRVSTMIATNGILLNERNIEELLQSGLDFIKIAVTGFTQKVYSIQHRIGNIEQIKANLELLARKNREGHYRCLIMLDYIYYRHNDHEVKKFYDFCSNIGIMFSVRPGNPYEMEEKELPLLERKGTISKGSACDWLWKVLSINWNGDILPCCDYVTWNGSKPYTRYEMGETIITDIWNGYEVIKMRESHKTYGRKEIPICAQCQRKGTAFKY